MDQNSCDVLSCLVLDFMTNGADKYADNEVWCREESVEDDNENHDIRPIEGRRIAVDCMTRFSRRWCGEIHSE
jgi:hypothetical protein